MGEFQNIPINVTAAQLEQIASKNVNITEINENSDDTSIPTSRVVYEALQKIGLKNGAVMFFGTELVSDRFEVDVVNSSEVFYAKSGDLFYNTTERKLFLIRYIHTSDEEGIEPRTIVYEKVIDGDDLEKKLASKMPIFGKVQVLQYVEGEGYVYVEPESVDDIKNPINIEFDMSGNPKIMPKNRGGKIEGFDYGGGNVYGNLSMLGNSITQLPTPVENSDAANKLYVDKFSNQKVNLPIDTEGNIQNGTNGQVLQTNGDGTTEWVDMTGGGENIAVDQTYDPKSANAQSGIAVEYAISSAIGNINEALETVLNGGN